METRFFLRFPKSLKLSTTRHKLLHTSSRTLQQANPIGDYYASLLDSSSLSSTQIQVTSKPPTTTKPSTTPTISTTPKDQDPGPSILFSSRLSSPLERRTEIINKSTLVAGVWVPPRPMEPDNCCMSGCVNCVYERYREELEEWAAARKEAEVALAKEQGLEKNKKRRRTIGEMDGGAIHTMVSMDDDGGGSETNWSPVETDADLFKDIPVGIREFMKSERRLKEKHAREGTVG
jgi:hypothetical protein